MPHDDVSLPAPTVSLFAMGPGWSRALRLASGQRHQTLVWLAEALAQASRQTCPAAFVALISAIPDGEEDVLDSGCDFIFVVYEAAIGLGCDPASVRLRPVNLHS